MSVLIILMSIPFDYGLQVSEGNIEANLLTKPSGASIFKVWQQNRNAPSAARLLWVAISSNTPP